MALLDDGQRFAGNSLPTGSSSTTPPTVLAQYVYTPHGELLHLDLPVPAGAGPEDSPYLNRVGFQGLFYENFFSDDTQASMIVEGRGLYHARNRWYEPRTGTWTTADPYMTGLTIPSSALFLGNAPSVRVDSLPGGFADGPNSYLAFGGNPHNSTDALGLFGLIGTFGATSIANDLNLDMLDTGASFLDAFRGLQNLIEEQGSDLEMVIANADSNTLDFALADYQERQQERASLLRGGGLFTKLTMLGAAGQAAKSWLEEGKKDYTVYIGYDAKTKKPVYVGITNHLGRRRNEWKGVYDLVAFTTDKVTKQQARAIEQTVIDANPHFKNIRASIARTRDVFNGALAWARTYLAGRKIKF